MTSRPIVLLTKRDRFSGDATAIARRTFGDTLVAFQGSAGDSFPLTHEQAPFAGILSFLSPWVVPPWALEAGAFALNFHPASRDYPGTGCYNFAIYERAAEYGAVCHHMAPTVDTGAIIAEARFPTQPDETVECLKLRTMIALSTLFAEIVEDIAVARPLPSPGTGWTRKPFRRDQLESLCILEPGISTAERALRIRATTYPGRPGPRERLSDGTLRPLPVPAREPIA